VTPGSLVEDEHLGAGVVLCHSLRCHENLFVCREFGAVIVVIDEVASPWIAHD
jgi:hypothetical protein